ncbi:MAG: pyruvate kinase [Deltaproteobacteria bacterium]|nr:pyruvate kinase [Deltaproteobacteria bacterium]
MRKTKIICTIGPATESYDMLLEMYNAGMNIVRLNMSHGDLGWHKRIIKHIKTINKKVKFPIAILLDTQGPEIRTGNIKSHLNLTDGSVISLTVRDARDVEETSIHINYDDLIKSVSVGDKITVDNGLINMEVLEKHERILRCRIIDGGVLKGKRHVNLPGIRVNLPAITSKDREDILFGLSLDVDFIALSFVREAQDIRQLKELLGSKADKIKVIAKIEDQEGVRNLEEIVRESDGIMVARGDLGVEINIEDLPNVQRDIVRLCAVYGKRVIVATHLLESMIENPIPTRAEVTDVANAVYEEVDAVMLSGETTIGKYPVKCITQLEKIAIKSETLVGLRFSQHLRNDSDKQALTLASVKLAEEIDAKGLVVFTRRGVLANLLSNCRPFKTPIYAFTNVPQTRRTLTLSRGVFPYRIDFSSDPEKTIQTAFNILVKQEGFRPGDKVVVISDVLAGDVTMNAIQIREITGENHNSFSA